MGNFIETALLWIASHPALKFGTIGVVSAIQGESGVLIGTLLIQRGEINLWELISVVVAVILAYESLVYCLGRTLRNTPIGGFIEKKIKQHERIEEALHENPAKTISLSRLILYFSLAVVFLSGWMRVSYYRFIRYRFLGILTWLGLVAPLFMFLAYRVGMEREEWVIREIFSAALIILVFLFGLRRVVAEWIGIKPRRMRRFKKN